MEDSKEKNKEKEKQRRKKHRIVRELHPLQSSAEKMKSNEK